MTDSIVGKRIAILATDRFEEVELTSPRDALTAAGATVHLVAPHDGEIQGVNHFDPGSMIAVDRTLENASADDYDALVLPGGVANPDQLRTDVKAVRFVRAFHDQGKPIAAICHGPWILIDANIVRDRKMTSWPSLRTDLGNAGAHWVNVDAVVDGKLVTSRNPDDLPAFNAAMLQVIAQA